MKKNETKNEKNEIKIALAKLPTKAKDIANKLRKLKIKGQIRNSGSCPIANYLSENTKYCIQDVDSNCIFYHKWNTGELNYDLPRRISRFIHNFDNGMYPFLEEEE